MTTNQKGNQGNQGQGNKGSAQSDNAGLGSRSGSTQRGTHEQHVDAGRQSHKNDDANQSSGGSASRSGSGTGSKQSDSSESSRSGSGAGSASRSGSSQGGTHEQHVEAGRQSHKNDKDGK